MYLSLLQSIIFLIFLQLTARIPVVALSIEEQSHGQRMGLLVRIGISRHHTHIRTHRRGFPMLDL